MGHDSGTWLVKRLIKRLRKERECAFCSAKLPVGGTCERWFGSVDYGMVGEVFACIDCDDSQELRGFPRGREGELGELQGSHGVGARVATAGPRSEGA